MTCRTIELKIIDGLHLPMRYRSSSFDIALEKIRESLDRAFEALGSCGFDSVFDSALKRKKNALSAWRIIIAAFKKNSIFIGAKIEKYCKSHVMGIFSILCLLALMQGFRSALFISFP
ncbi:hypothetical protein C5B76_07150 [Aeromonas salmonicida]|nr:hypothetical protein C5B76_07150 [Aeromonas salmonicida]